MRKTTTTRRKTQSTIPQTPQTTTTPSLYPIQQHFSTPNTNRDSDASFCSSQSTNLPNPSDRSYQLSALRTVNSYLNSHSFPISLKHPLPSAKDITETLKFLVNRLGFDSKKLDEDLNDILKFLKCPLKLNKSALRAPGTPHAWPNLLAVVHWLVQIIKYKEYVENADPGFLRDREFVYTVRSYVHYVRGEDDEVETLDGECVNEMVKWKEVVVEEVKTLEENAASLEERLEGFKVGPSRLECLEKDKLDLEKDLAKFHTIIEMVDGNLADWKGKLEGKEKELEVKIEERKRVVEENEELRRKIEEQGINSRDAERMRRELQAVERDVEEMEVARSGWEEKVWEIESRIGHKFKELEGFAMDCNQAIRRLKLGNGFQYQLDANGSTPSKVLGLNYKSILKPALASLVEDVKRNSMEKYQELISLRQQSSESAVKLEEKRNCIVALQSHIDSVEAQLNLMSKGAAEYVSKCASEARTIAEEVEMEACKMSTIEKEAAQCYQTSNAQLQETVKQIEEELKLCAQELFQLINSVSTYKEYMGSKVSQMRNGLLETARDVADMYKGYCPSKGAFQIQAANDDTSQLL